MAEKIHRWLAPGGEFVFSIEHPIFTAYGSQDWHRDAEGNILHFPVDNYFFEGAREAVFLGERVTKYHHTLTTILDGLLTRGFQLRRVVEPQPPERYAGHGGHARRTAKANDAAGGGAKGIAGARKPMAPAVLQEGMGMNAAIERMIVEGMVIKRKRERALFELSHPQKRDHTFWLIEQYLEPSLFHRIIVDSPQDAYSLLKERGAPESSPPPSPPRCRTGRRGRRCPCPPRRRCSSFERAWSPGGR